MARGLKPVEGSGVGSSSAALDAEGEGSALAVAEACGSSVGSISLRWSTESRVSIHMPSTSSSTQPAPIAPITMRLRRFCRASSYSSSSSSSSSVSSSSSAGASSASAVSAAAAPAAAPAAPPRSAAAWFLFTAAYMLPLPSYRRQPWRSMRARRASMPSAYSCSLPGTGATSSVRESLRANLRGKYSYMRMRSCVR